MKTSITKENRFKTPSSTGGLVDKRKNFKRKKIKGEENKTLLTGA